MQNTDELNSKNSGKKNAILILALVFLITFPTVPFLLYKYGVSNPMQTNKKINFEIRSGDGVSGISEDLKDAGLINSPFLFKAYVKLNGIESKIQAGSYVIPPRSSIVDLAIILQKGRNDVSITFVEGWRVEQLAEIASKELANIEYKDFVLATRQFEGQLFPDTYLLNRDISQNELLSILKETFEEKTEPFISEYTKGENELSIKEIFVMASIVEREVANEKDRPIVAGILIKRWKEGMRLEADATTQYAVALRKHCSSEICGNTGVGCVDTSAVAVCEEGLNKDHLVNIDWWPNGLTKEDLDFDDPFNTRSNAGLPPKPISSFGISALEAVINYSKTNYYFYLTDGEGVTHYAETLDGHNENVVKYLR